MTWDDFVYGFMLIISMGCGLLSTRSGSLKKYFMSLTGLLIALIVCGFSIWHSLFVTIFSIIFICLFPKRSHIIVFIFCFGYLVFFRTCHLLGFAKPSSHSNALQLILSLKLVGAAFEIKDSLERENKLHILLNTDSDLTDDIEQLKRQIKYLNVKADPVDLFVYSYCFVGLLTGPYFKYRVFLDCLSYQDTDYLNIFHGLTTRMKKAILIGLAYLMLSHFYYIEYAKTELFYSRSWLYRLVFMSVMFLVFRLRMYFAWTVSECVCMCGGLGGYPTCSAPQPGQGPTDLEALDRYRAKQSEESERLSVQVSFETVRNVSIAGCEWSPSVRDGMRSWNTSVQFWLASFVYRRCPIRSLRTPVTMLVSAFWHGVHPGYYLSFLTIPLALRAESALHALVGPPREEVVGEGGLEASWTVSSVLCWPRLASWLYKMRVFDYCCMGFLLLEAGATWRYWCSIGLCMHVTMAVLILMDVLRPLWQSRTSLATFPHSAQN